MILIGFSLVPLISQKIDNAQNTTLTPSSKFLLDSVPIVFILTIITIALSSAVIGLRIFGRDYDDGIEDVDDDGIEEDEKKQTYFGYVQERLAIEKKMRNTHGFFWWLRG